MALLTKAQILAADDLLREVVEVPEWGGEVMVRGLDGAARDQYEAEFLLIGEIQAGERPTYELDLLNARARLVALSVVDENDQRMFSDEDVVALGKKSAQALDRVYEVAQRLSGLSKKDEEELRKNSQRGRRGGSSSA